MRLLYITPYVPSPIRVRPYELLRALCAGGLRPTLLCPASSADAPALAELAGWGLEVIAVPVGVAQRLPALLRGTRAGLPLQAAFGAPRALEQALRRLLTTRRFDLVHVEHLRAAALLPLVQPLPVVYDAVDCISDLLAQTRRLGPDRRSRWLAALELARTAAFERAVCASADLTVVTSAKDQHDLRRLAPGAAVEVVPNGVDTLRFTPPTGARAEQTIVFSGKLSYHANVAAAERLVEQIMPRVWAQQPQAQLWIVGSAPPRAIRRYAADARIVVTGRVPAIAPFLQRATVAACPLRYGVGIQNKVLEALATATPTVIDGRCLAALQTRPGQDLLVADDDDSFAAALVQLLNDAALRQQIGAAGRAYVAHTHRWTTSAQLLLEAYQQVLQLPGVPLPPSSVRLQGALSESRRHV